ncbi:PREDICTED: uncharacterized protein LOC108365437 [Rhagoletis zephyria]|uniref:uncharacterized protein LOC108365437 n=1 Tax=Rhagoletis zephyria TaxID=28612 RepID=UPI00081129CA|nr:PREDICTED: uncharacterized protein LOC108365437 [Rhagoletis zephyria]
MPSEDENISPSDVAIPQLERTYCDPNETSDLTFEEFALFSDLQYSKKPCESIEDVEGPSHTEVEHEQCAKISRGYQQNENKLRMRIKELEAQVEDLTRKFKDLQESVIIPATDASIHAVKFARMIVNTRQSYNED